LGVESSVASSDLALARRVATRGTRDELLALLHETDAERAIGDAAEAQRHRAAVEALLASLGYAAGDATLRQRDRLQLRRVSAWRIEAAIGRVPTVTQSLDEALRRMYDLDVDDAAWELM
jgi:hypothetical protein